MLKSNQIPVLAGSGNLSAGNALLCSRPLAGKAVARSTMCNTLWYVSRFWRLAQQRIPVPMHQPASNQNMWPLFLCLDGKGSALASLLVTIFIHQSRAICHHDAKCMHLLQKFHAYAVRHAAGASAAPDYPRQFAMEILKHSFRSNTSPQRRLLCLQNF